MTRHAVRGISAPPEVVFNTVTDPDRRGAWLPGGLAVEGSADTLEARLTGDAGGVLQVHAGDSGGSSVELRLDSDGAASPEDILRAHEREVTDNFNAG